MDIARIRHSLHFTPSRFAEEISPFLKPGAFPVDGFLVERIECGEYLSEGRRVEIFEAIRKRFPEATLTAPEAQPEPRRSGPLRYISASMESIRKNHRPLFCGIILIVTGALSFAMWDPDQKLPTTLTLLTLVPTLYFTALERK